MASDFYQKTLALHEEFRQRELHYLNTDRSFTGMKNKERNFPLEEYLHKITEREKETEKEYSETMKKMDDLHQRTELMSMKIEKLQILMDSINARNFQATSSICSLEGSTGSNLKFYYSPNEDLNVTQEQGKNYTDLSTKTVGKSSQASNSSQTDALLCRQCNIPVSLYKSVEFQPAMPSTTFARNAVTDSNILARTEYPDKAKQPVQFHAQLESSKIHATTKSAEQPNGNFHTNSSELPTSNKSMQVLNEELPNDDTFPMNRTEVPTSIKSMNEELPQNSASEELSYEQLASTDVSRSKSDDESMNHEFDFLESETKGLRAKPYIPNLERNDSSPVAPVLTHRSSLVATTGSVPELPTTVPKGLVSGNGHPVPPQRRRSSNLKMNGNLPMKNVSEKPVATNQVKDVVTAKSVKAKLDNGKRLDFASRKSSTAFEKDSSVTDTEESSSEKNVPITSTAAYQVLLGKVAVSQRAVEKTSDSDTADEIESALAAATKKGNNIIIEKSEDYKAEDKKKSNLQTHTSVDLKDATRRSSQALTSKPQSKLSKNTRKMLGLDTSSGSELEPEIINPKQQSKEDSDEFDFYD